MDRQQTTSPAIEATNFVPPTALPRLEAGDHLDQPTFHARYEAMPSSFHAELVEGMVIVPSPLMMNHGKCHGLIMCWLVTYQAKTPGVSALDNATSILAEDTEPQPDGMLILDPKCGGRTRDQEGYAAGPPELIVEVATSSAAYDLHGKFRAYESAGVLEYVVVVLHEKQVKWFVLRDGQYTEIEAAAEHVYHSPMFPGLWLDTTALLSGNAAQLLATLERGLATPEHAHQAATWQQLLEQSAAPPINS